MEANAGNWTWAIQDAQGSVRGEVDNTLAVLGIQHPDPYGNQFGQQGSIGLPFAYTGEMRDPIGLQYHRARYYNPAMGGWLSLDPFEGVAGRPMSLNGYSWVEGQVVNAVDASGMFGVTDLQILAANNSCSVNAAITQTCFENCIARATLPGTSFTPEQIDRCVADCFGIPYESPPSNDLFCHIFDENDAGVGSITGSIEEIAEGSIIESIRNPRVAKAAKIAGPLTGTFKASCQLGRGDLFGAAVTVGTEGVAYIIPIVGEVKFVLDLLVAVGLIEDPVDLMTEYLRTEIQENSTMMLEFAQQAFEDTYRQSTDPNYFCNFWVDLSFIREGLGICAF